jgi:predicted permease
VFDQILQDTRIAIRGFRRSPRFAISAILTIAIAVGAATAVFSVADRSLFRPLPYRADERLVSIGVVAPVINSRDWMFAGAYRSWRDLTSDTFESMTSWKGVVDCDQTGDSQSRLSCAQVEANFLSTLGVAPILGRNFEPDEDRPGAEPVALISNGLWQRQFGGEREVLDQRIAIDGAPARIIGVLPPTFETPSLAPVDALLPLKLAPEGERQRLVHVIGRLRNSVSVHEAGQRLERLFQLFLEAAPADFRKAVPMRLRVVSLRDQQTADQRLALWMLLAAVLSFLLIACANVAHLLLARSSTRRHEFMVRASLGASGWRLARQALTESTVLAIAGGAVGCGLGYWLLQLFQVLAPDGAIRLSQAAIDLRVVAFSLGLSLLAAFLFGLAPAIERLRTEALSSVRVAGGRRRVLRGALVSVQLAISVVLLSATGTLLWSLWRLQQVQLGIRPASVVTASLVLPQPQYPNSERQAQFFVDLFERLRDVPGFTSVAIADSLPPGGDPRSKPFVALLGGGDSEEKGMEGLVKWRHVTPGYFETMGIAMVRGRGFSREDFLAGRKAIVLSESLHDAFTVKPILSGATLVRKRRSRSSASPPMSATRV